MAPPVGGYVRESMHARMLPLRHMNVLHSSGLPAPVRHALEFLRDPRSRSFEELALEIFDYQMAKNAPYHRFCERLGRARPSDWTSIPPLPARAFKEFDLWTAAPSRVFLTSGTTRGSEKRGRHGLPALDLYDAAWEPPFRRHVIPDCDRMRILSLIPAEDELPESSLSYMAARILERCGGPGSQTVMGARGIDQPRLQEALKDPEPSCILATSLAMAALLDTLPAPIQLPKGSRIMDTGGFKGRARETDRDALLELYRDRLGIPPRHVIGEYGMTELCSQFYETNLTTSPRRFVGPPWVRTRAIDPETLSPLPFGKRGLLAHWDLANAWTVLAVLTEDIGIVHEDGFELFGRAPGSDLRGCSLVTEELLDGR